MLHACSSPWLLLVFLSSRELVRQGFIGFFVSHLFISLLLDSQAIVGEKYTPDFLIKIMQVSLLVLSQVSRSSHNESSPQNVVGGSHHSGGPGHAE